MKLHTPILLFLFSVCSLRADNRPLIALDFNQPTEEGHFSNKGTLKGEAKPDAVGSPIPETVTGITGAAQDKALAFAGEQVSTQTQYPKHSRVTLDVPDDLNPMENWSLSMWFTAEKQEQWQHVLVGWGKCPKVGPSTGLLVTLNPDADGNPQFRIDAGNQSFYSAPVANGYGENWIFMTLVFQEGELTIYTADRESDVKLLQGPKQFDAKELSSLPAALYLGSADTPYSNLANHLGKIDSFLFYDRTLSLEEVKKLHQLGRKQILP